MAKKATQMNLARHLGFTNSRKIRDLFAAGILTGDSQNIDIDFCRIEYITYMRNMSARWKTEDTAPTDETKDPDVQLAYYRVEQIELAKIKKRKALGELIERSDMIFAVSSMIARAKRVFLKIPKAHRKTLAVMTDELEVGEYLDGLIKEGLDELASTPVETIGREIEEDDIDLGPETP